MELEKYQVDVLKFVRSKISNLVDAEDVVQEIFAKALEKRDQLNDAAKLKSWLFTIAFNQVQDYYRGRKKSIDLSLSMMALEENNADVFKNDIDGTGGTQEETHHLKDCLKGIIKNLPEKYSKPLYLSDILGLKHQEVAEKLNLPLTTVKSQIQRARKKVAEGYMYCCDFKPNDKGILVGTLKDKSQCKICH